MAIDCGADRLRALDPAAKTAADADEVEVNATSGRSDFNGDGYADLASFSVPKADVGEWAWKVYLMYGSASGIQRDGAQVLTAESLGFPLRRFAPQAFTLVTGNFDGDPYGDLAIGNGSADIAANEPLLTRSGVVLVVYGSASGLTKRRAQEWTQDSPGFPGSTEGYGTLFGSAVAAGDFGRGAEDDLAIGDQGELVSGRLGAGVVHVLYAGSTSGCRLR